MRPPNFTTVGNISGNILSGNGPLEGPVWQFQTMSRRKRSAFRLPIQPNMPSQSSRARRNPPIAYRDRQGRTWNATEVAQLRVVSPAIDGPNLCLVTRFEREGAERCETMGPDELESFDRQTVRRGSHHR